MLKQMSSLFIRNILSNRIWAKVLYNNYDNVAHKVSLRVLAKVTDYATWGLPSQDILLCLAISDPMFRTEGLSHTNTSVDTET